MMNNFYHPTENVKDHVDIPMISFLVRKQKSEDVFPNCILY